MKDRINVHLTFPMNYTGVREILATLRYTGFVFLRVECSLATAGWGVSGVPPHACVEGIAMESISWNPSYLHQHPNDGRHTVYFNIHFFK